MKDTTVQTSVHAALLAEGFEEEGFRLGAPPHLTAETLAIDARLCAGCTCAACKRRGLEYRPYYHRLTGKYRGLAVCLRCGHGEEV